MMQINIKRIDPGLPMPDYQTDGSVFFDLYVRETIAVEPGDVGLLPLNVIIQTPPGYFLLVVPRSSTLLRIGLPIPNGIGVIDQDYCGEEDEIKLLVHNFTKNTVTIQRGDRIAQAGFVPVERVVWQEADEMATNNRGGFGSTGS